MRRELAEARQALADVDMHPGETLVIAASRLVSSPPHHPRVFFRSGHHARHQITTAFAA